MIRFIEVDTRQLDAQVPEARLVGPTLPPKFWWWGGEKWEGALEGPLLVKVNATEDLARCGLPDFFRTTNARICSARLKAVLQASGAEIEFWPATILMGENVIEDKFFAANSLVRRKAVDMARSQLELDPDLGDVLSVQMLVLDEQKLADVGWAVVDEVQRIAVSQDVQNAIVHSSCTGCRFLDPAEVRY